MNTKQQKSVEQALFFGIQTLSVLLNPRLEAQVLLCHALGCDRAYLLIHPTNMIEAQQWMRYQTMIEKRLQHIPIAYIVGSTQWYGYTIQVTPDVLIPRDETEILMEHIENHQRVFVPRTCFDVGCGSGCIALALSDMFVDAQVLGIDLSAAALQVAEINTQDKPNITLIQSDLLLEVPQAISCDIIVANLPYVPHNISVTPEVAAEPQEAIFSDNNGMAHIAQLCDELKVKQIQWKELWLEFLPESWDSVQAIFSNMKIQPKTDVSGQIFFAVITQD